MAPLFFFTLIVSAGIFLEGGDTPAGTLLLRAGFLLLAAALLLRSETLTARPTVPDLLVLFLWVLGAASLARAEYRWVSYQWFLHHTAALAAYLLLRARPDPDGRIPRACAVLIAAAAGIEMILMGVQRAAGEYRLTGTLQNPSFLAEFLLYGAMAAFFMGKETGETRPVRRALLGGLAILFLVGIWMTRSRAGIILVIAAGGYLAAGRVGWKRALAAVGLAVAGITLIPNPLRDRFLGIGDLYAFERLDMWRAASRIFLDHPMGVGPGHFKYYWHAVRGPVEGSVARYARYALTPHSEFFSFLSELGAPGAAAFLGLGATGLVSLRRAVRASDPIASGAVMILFVSYVHALVDSNYHIPGLLLVNAAALAVVANRLWEPVARKDIRVKGLVRWPALALLLAMAAYAGMTYAGAVLEEKGREALHQGRFDEAERRFLQAAAADPWRATYPDSASAARYRLFESGLGTACLSLAIDSEMEARLRNPLEYRYPARLGFLYLKAADHFRSRGRERFLGAAWKSYTESLKLNPHNAEINYRMAVLSRGWGRRDEARRRIEALLAEEPLFPRGWVALGEILEEEDRRKALDAYERALDIHKTWRDRAADADEKEFLALDAESVAQRVRELKERR